MKKRLRPACALFAGILLSACTSSDEEPFNATLTNLIREDEGVLDTSLVLLMEEEPECWPAPLAKTEAPSAMVQIGMDSLLLRDVADGTPFTGSAVYLDDDIHFLYAEGLFEDVRADRALGYYKLLNSFLGNAPDGGKRRFKARICPDTYLGDLSGGDTVSAAAP